MPATLTLVQKLRDMFDESGYSLNDRLPPERDLCEMVGTTRNKLRGALAELEADGRIWRHVGRGTFVGPRPVLNLTDVTYLRDQIKPENVMTVRASIEPELCRLAARNAKKSDFEQIKYNADRCRTAEDWRAYEASDNNLHHAIARATQNQLFQYFFETLNVVRRSIVWGQPRQTQRPPRDYSSFVEHDAIVAAITDGDADLAAEAMTTHLRSVFSRTAPNSAPKPSQ